MLARVLLTLAATATAVSAFSVTAPNSQTWWVADSQNVLVWNCRSEDSPQDFTILVGNTDTTKFAAATAIVSIQTNADCSKVLTPQQVNFEAGTGYLVLLANTLNISDIYAQSEPFEIKAKGAAYPTTTAAVGGATISVSGSATGTSDAADTTTTDNSAIKTSVGLGFGALGALLGLMTF